MHRFISQTSLGVYNSHLRSLKADKVIRVVNRGTEKPLSTCSVKFCEKKNDDISSNQDQTALEKSPIQSEQKEERGILGRDEGPQQEGEARVESVATKSTQVKSGVAKSGKEGLLDLLGAMKVEVTNKRKLKILKAKQIADPAMQLKPKPAPLESTFSMFQKAKEEVSSQSDSLEPELVAAASAAASTMPNQRKAESELLRQLRQRKALTEAQKKGSMENLGVIIADMKVGKKTGRQNASPANQIRFDDDGKGYTEERGITAELANVRKRRNLFPAKRLNIFSPVVEGVETTPAKPTLWDIEFTNQLSSSTNQIPRNGFEEMIQWTKEGKLWEYPINNEVGLEEEASVSFYEHVFLEKHLEDGFPRHGPVRHFMELVVAGLSRNPYLTVQQKKEHISWFRDYFHQKEDILKEAEI